ncbi:MAG: type II toxin-antitoxin system VapC family toxin [Bacteroidales bacterium]|nr:type II toxin-antitoxin system VapC family toxin [Bacteroidales bacterium]
MGTRYLLDTNAILDFMGKKLPVKSRFFLSEIIDDEINISAINKIELLGFTFVDQTLIDFVSFAKVYPIDDETIEKTIDIRKKYKLKLPDAIIAATAIINDFTLVTHNIKDFQKITELQVIDSYAFS